MADSISDDKRYEWDCPKNAVLSTQWTAAVSKFSQLKFPSGTIYLYPRLYGPTEKVAVPHVLVIATADSEIWSQSTLDDILSPFIPVLVAVLPTDFQLVVDKSQTAYEAVYSHYQPFVGHVIGGPGGEALCFSLEETFSEIAQMTGMAVSLSEFC